MNRLAILAWFAFIGTAFGFGVVVPPESDFLKLSPGELTVIPYEAELTITIENNFVRGELKQTFFNPREYPQEGVFEFMLPRGTEVVGFATWDGPRKLVGKIFERQKALKIYQRLRDLAIDPGIVIPSARGLFTVKIAPVDPLATKLVGIQFAGYLTEVDGRVKFILPLPPGFESMRFRRLQVNVSVHGRTKISRIVSRGVKLSFSGAGKDYFARSEFENFHLTGPLEIDFSYSDTAQSLSAFLTGGEDSVFGLALFSPPVESTTNGNTAILVDMSASVDYFWNQVRAAAVVCAGISHGFYLAAFNDSVYPFGDGISHDTASAGNFLDNLQPAYGTDIYRALKWALSRENISSVVLITDGFPSVGEIGRDAILDLARNGVPIYAVAVGDDANDDLLRQLADTSGGAVMFLPSGLDERSTGEEVYRWMVPYLSRRWHRVVRVEVGGNEVNFYSPAKLFYGGMTMPISFVLPGEIPQNAEVVICTDDGKKYSAPASWVDNGDYIRRMWARGRVDYLLAQIAAHGEKDRWVNEIIALSKKYVFVTPYTAFLAAPSAVLRPNIVQPSDPKIVVDAPYAVRVVVEMPWGEQITAAKNPRTGRWEARFLVPRNVKSGEYWCTLIITDRAGNQWRQRKKFVIDTKPPTIKAIVPKTARAGDVVLLKVFAPQDTRTILAKLPGGKTLSLRYSDVYKASVAKWTVPELPPGEYIIRFVATDFAGNQREAEAKIKITL